MRAVASLIFTMPFILLADQAVAQDDFTTDVVLEKIMQQAAPKKARESGYCCMAFDVTKKAK